MSIPTEKGDTSGFPRPAAGAAPAGRRAPGCLGTAIALLFLAALLFGAGAVFALVLEHVTRH